MVRRDPPSAPVAVGYAVTMSDPEARAIDREPRSSATEARPPSVSGRARRFASYWLTRLLVGMVALIATMLGASQLGERLPLPGAVRFILGYGAVVAVYVGFVRLFERRRAVELGRANAAGDVARGALGGSALFAATIGVLLLLGVGHVARGAGLHALLTQLGAALGAAVFEELLARGVVFRVLEEGLGSWLALLLSAAIFGGLHGHNPGATILSTLAIALEAGVLLAAAFVQRRTLWLPIGLHFGWNFTEGGIFGASVSGFTAHGWLRSDFHGAAWLSGGAFGPEASLVAVLLCGAAGCALLIVAARRGRIIAPPWQRPPSR